MQLQESALPPKLRAGEALSLYTSFYRRPEEAQRLCDRVALADAGRVVDAFLALTGRGIRQADDGGLTCRGR